MATMGTLGGVGVLRSKPGYMKVRFRLKLASSHATEQAPITYANKSDLTLDLNVIHECLYPASSTDHLSNSDNTISFKENSVKEGSGQSGSSPFVCVGHRQVGRHGTQESKLAAVAWTWRKFIKP